MITYYAFPETWHQNNLLSLLIVCCAACAIACGVYLSGTIGPRQCSFIWPLLGALLGVPFLMKTFNRTPAFNIAAWISSWIFEWKIDWDREYFPNKPELHQQTKKRKARPHLLKRSLIVIMGGILFASILSSAVYQNLQIEINGEQIKIRDVLTDFIRTRQYVHTYDRVVRVVKELYSFCQTYGFDGVWEQIWTSLDDQNDEGAYEVRGMTWRIKMNLMDLDSSIGL